MQWLPKNPILKKGRELTDAFLKNMASQKISKKLLVVEDCPNDLELFKTQAEGIEGCTFDYARSGEEAIELLCKEKYSLVFVDLHLKGMSGLDFIAKLDNALKIPFVVVTGTYGLSSDECDKAAELGALFLIKKPVHHNQIKTLVNPIE